MALDASGSHLWFSCAGLEFGLRDVSFHYVWGVGRVTVVSCKNTPSSSRLDATVLEHNLGSILYSQAPRLTVMQAVRLLAKSQYVPWTALSLKLRIVDRVLESHNSERNSP